MWHSPSWFDGTWFGRGMLPAGGSRGEVEAGFGRLHAEATEKITQPESLACGNIAWHCWRPGGYFSTPIFGRLGRWGGGACR